MMELKLEIVGKEVIKAASPSPPHEFLQLSLLDLTIGGYVPMIFFYETEDLTSKSPEIVSQKLKSSLSQTLTHFYPLAGRIEGVSIKCNNEGAIFTETRTDLLLSDYLMNFDPHTLSELFPKITPGESSKTWPLLSVQVNIFGSGSGVGIAICVSHHICDAASLSTFVQGWAAIVKQGSSDELNTPQFAGTTIFPAPDTNFQAPSLDGVLKFRGKCVTNRFVFESSKIVDLKHKATSKNVSVPTRVEVISSLIWKCSLKAINLNLDTPNSSAMTLAMDLRLRIPSNVLSQDAIGNLQMLFMIKRNSGSEFATHEIVGEFRKKKEEFNNMVKENLEDYDATIFGLKLMARTATFMSEFNPDMDLYNMTSWCRKPFYEVDFGWGRPVWVGFGYHIIQEDYTYAVLMDTKDGEGVEAWVSLPEQEMLAFVCDQELLSYASLNPPIFI